MLSGLFIKYTIYNLTGASTKIKCNIYNGIHIYYLLFSD